MSKIPYRAIPISLETDPVWLSLSLKRRALFLFIATKAVSVESYPFKGINLTFGEYAWSYQTLADRFNETVCPDDHFSKTGCHKAVESFIEIGLVNIQKYGSGVRSFTVIKITHADTYELIKNQRCTINDAWCTNGERSEGFNGERSELEEIPSQNITTTDKSKNENDGGERIEKVVNIGMVNDQQDLTESTIKTMFRKDNVRTVPFSNSANDDVDASQRFKLVDDQIESLKWLKGENIDTSDSTLCFWSKTYSLKRLKEVHRAAVMAKESHNGKKKSIGAVMNYLLKNDIVVETDSKSVNEAFIGGFMERIPDMNWQIEKKYVTCKIKGIKKEVFLNLHPEAFVNQLMMLENYYKDSKT